MLQETGKRFRAARPFRLELSPSTREKFGRQVTLQPVSQSDELPRRTALLACRITLATGAITVLVSHRFSTVRMADIILVVASGQVVERGAHAQLMAQKGLYAELYGLQASAYR